MSVILRYVFQRVIFLLITLMFLGLGGFFVYKVADSALIYHSLYKNGVHTNAEILELKLVPAKKGRKEMYVKYQYEFDGVFYVGDRADVLFWRRGTRGFKELELIVSEGCTVTCYVDPNDPNESTLDRSFSYLSTVGWFLFCCIFPIVGLYFARAIFTAEFWRSKASSKTPTCSA